MRIRAGADIVKVMADGVALADGEVVAAQAVSMDHRRAGVTAWRRPAGLQVDGRGRILTDESLRSVSHPNVYAIGDAAAIRQSYGVMHGTCQSGITDLDARRRFARP